MGDQEVKEALRKKGQRDEVFNGDCNKHLCYACPCLHRCKEYCLSRHMKRSLDSSDSLGALMTMCPAAAEEHSPRNNNAVFQQSMMLEGIDEEESSHLMMTEKKRRLSVDQVKALEKNFEVENKLEPERKVKLAQELGLQPRQVAVWFQNRRARWKTKQLERDYGALKANYDTLKLNYDSLQQDKEALLKQIKELKSRIKEEETESDVSVKEETRVNETLEKEMMEPCETECKDLKDLNYECLNNGVGTASFMAADLKDGASDSDSSAILNEDNSCNVAVSSSGGLQSHGHHQFLVVSPVSSPLKFNCSSPSSMNCFQYQKAYQSGQHVKMEEHNFFITEEACDFFSEEQAPTLQWYCSDNWS